MVCTAPVTSSRREGQLQRLPQAIDTEHREIKRAIPCHVRTAAGKRVVRRIETRVWRSLPKRIGSVQVAIFASPWRNPRHRTRGPRKHSRSQCQIPRRLHQLATIYGAPATKIGEPQAVIPVNNVTNGCAGRNRQRGSRSHVAEPYRAAVNVMAEPLTEPPSAHNGALAAAQSTPFT